MTFYFCDPCDKSFTGIRPYNDHIASEKHKKKVNASAMEVYSTAQGSLEQETDSFIIQIGIEYRCTLCKLSLNSLLQAKNHVSGSKHQKLKIEHCSSNTTDLVSKLKTINLPSCTALSPDENNTKFSFHDMQIDDVLTDVTVFGVNDPIIFLPK